LPGCFEPQQPWKSPQKNSLRRATVFLLSNPHHADPTRLLSPTPLLRKAFASTRRKAAVSLDAARRSTALDPHLVLNGGK
jgi:hypothetical protein